MSTQASSIDSLPLWALFIVTMAVVLLSAEAGWRLGNRMRQRPNREKETPVSAIVGATLGLLAFLCNLLSYCVHPRLQARPVGKAVCAAMSMVVLRPLQIREIAPAPGTRWSQTGEFPFWGAGAA